MEKNENQVGKLVHKSSAVCHGALLYDPAAVICVVSTSLATSPRHSEHKPTSNRSPSLTTPEKLVIVTSWRHLQHQNTESNSFLLLLGMPAHNLAAGVVNLGMDSMSISVIVHADRKSTRLNSSHT